MRNLLKTSAFVFLFFFCAKLNAQELPGKNIALRISPYNTFKIKVDAFSDFLTGGDPVKAEASTATINTDIIGRMAWKGGMARLGIGHSLFITKAEGKQTFSGGGYDKFSGQLKQNRFNVTPAYERHFRHEMIGFYSGLAVPIIIIGKLNGYGEDEFADEFGNVDASKVEVEVPGGFATGIKSYAGFSLYLGQKFSVGTEISYGLGYINAGGKSTIKDSFNGMTDVFKGDKLEFNGLTVFPFSAALMLSFNL